MRPREGPRTWDFYDGQETLGLVPPAYRFQRMQMLKEGSDFAKELGVSDLVTHVGYMPENPHDANYPGILAAVKDVAGGDAGDAASGDHGYWS